MPGLYISFYRIQSSKQLIASLQYPHLHPLKQNRVAVKLDHFRTRQFYKSKKLFVNKILSTSIPNVYDLTPYSLVEIYGCFKRTTCLRHQHLRCQQVAQLKRR